MLTGATASGKTALSLQLAAQYPIEIVSVDAMMVYRGLDIGTAKPTAAEQAQVPHHLIDIREPDQDYHVAQFVADAERCIAEIIARGGIPLLVGGTGFYLTALIQGLPTTPAADMAVQAEIEAELYQHGLDVLLTELAQYSVSEAQRMERNPRRVVRALEILRRTGQVPSEFPRQTPQFSYQLHALGIAPELLEARIIARVDQMLALGLVEEVRGLMQHFQLDAPNSRPPTALQAIGYKEVLAYLRQEYDADTMREYLIRHTRQYAKRQHTWLRTQLGATLTPADSLNIALSEQLTAFLA